MRIVFCTTCKGRAQHIELTLLRNLADNPEAKFVLLDYNSPDHLVKYLKTACEFELGIGQLIVYSYRGEHPFRMAHAKNMAHRLGIREGADVLCNLDADNFTGPDFSRYITERMTDESFMWARMIPGHLSRGISGRIVVSRRSFVNVGGYDEKYDTWAPDDKDFNLRLRRLGHTALEIEPRFLSAVPHNDKMRFREYRHAKTAACAEDDQFELVNDSEATIANFGKFGCGTVYRNFDFETPIELKPLPTRIFGIGLHKTGTTSLHHALNALGYDSAHWKSAHWAKAIWEQMRASGRSHTLEKHYALSDLPIPMLFRELDRTYPGSKFILTTRDERKWLNSVRNHWSHEKNPFRSTWSHDPFTHKVHRELYGRKDFDPETFIARFRSHNAAVLQYFQRRPGDLLVMDLDANAGYRELCGFLGCTAPPFDYPISMATR